jgi:general stress protein CsbA
MVIAIIAAVLVAGITAFIASNITDNIDTIVTSCLISVWVAEIIILILRSRITYNKRIKLMDTGDVERQKKGKNKLKISYILSVTIFSIIFGFILYNIKDQLINSMNGTGKDMANGTTNSPMLYIKIIITVVLVAVFITRIIQQKNKGNEDKKDEV